MEILVRKIADSLVTSFRARGNKKSRIIGYRSMQTVPKPRLELGTSRRTPSLSHIRHPSPGAPFVSVPTSGPYIDDTSQEFTCPELLSEPKPALCVRSPLRLLLLRKKVIESLMADPNTPKACKSCSASKAKCVRPPEGGACTRYVGCGMRMQYGERSFVALGSLATWQLSGLHENDGMERVPVPRERGERG